MMDSTGVYVVRVRGLRPPAYRFTLNAPAGNVVRVQVPRAFTLKAPAIARLVRRNPAVTRLIITGLALEAVLALGLLLPLSLFRYPSIIDSSRPLTVALGQGWSGVLRFALPVSLAFALLALACSSARAVPPRAGRRIVLAFAGLYMVTLLPLNPVGAHDVYHNVADARTFWLYRDNPMVTPPSAHPHDPWFHHVIAWKNTPSVYGPLWYAVSGLPLLLHSTDLWENVVAHKALTAAVLLATAGLAMRIAAREAPGHTMVAGILIAWNPLMLFETAGNAHNDIMMMFFTLLVFYAAARRWWLAVFPLLALAVASKYAMVVLGPVLLLWMLRRPDISRRQVAASLGLGVALACVLLAPFFLDPRTWRSLGGEARFLAFSPAALLHVMLWKLTGTGGLELLLLVRAVTVAVFAAGYAAILWRMRSAGALADLARASSAVVALLLAVATWFGPWYAVFFVPLAALVPDRRLVVLTLLISASAMLQYVPVSWLASSDPIRLHAACVAVAFVPPAVAGCAFAFTRNRSLPLPAWALVTGQRWRPSGPVHPVPQSNDAPPASVPAHTHWQEPRVSAAAAED